MKAELLSCTVCEGVTAWLHDEHYEIMRILVPEANNLVLSTERDNFYVWDEFEKDKTDKIVRHIEVPDQLVKDAISFMNNRRSLIEQFKDLLE